MVRPGAGRGSARRRAIPQLDAPEERRGWMEDKAVLSGVELRPELGDAAVVVGLPEPTSSPPRRSSTRTPRAGSPRPVSSTWVESETLTPRIFSPGPDVRAAIRPHRPARGVRPSRPPPATYRRSTRWGAEKTSPATLSTAPELEAVRPPDGDVGAAPRFQRTDVGASQDSAPPRVASRNESRTVIASGPPRPRATRSACLTSKKRSLRSFDAEPSTPRPTRAPASTSARTGATPAPA